MSIAHQTIMATPLLMLWLSWLASQQPTGASSDIICTDFFSYDSEAKFDVILDYTYVPPSPTTLLYLTHLDQTLTRPQIPLRDPTFPSTPMVFPDRPSHQFKTVVPIDHAHVPTRH